MVDFYTKFTTTGLALEAAYLAGGDPYQVAQFAVGDGNGAYYNPDGTEIALANEVYRNTINNIIVDLVDPTKITFECVIPSTAGPFEVRELGLFTALGQMVAIAQIPYREKPNPNTSGAISSIYIKAVLQVNNADAISITIDPDSVIVNQDDLNLAKTEINQTIQNLIPDIFKTYCVNSGNVDANGYADLIHKESDTEVSFKVGGIYPDMRMTFPNGKHYIISSIPNVTGLSTDTTYTFVIFEENLTLLEDGTYSAIVTPVQIGYEQIEGFPALTAASHSGFTATYLGTTGADPYNIFDTNASTNFYLNTGGWPPQTYYPAGSLDTSEGISRMSSFVLAFDETKNIEYFVVNQASLYGLSMTYLTSTDGGVTWSAASQLITLGASTKIDINQEINAIKFRFYHGYSVVDDLAFPGEKWYTRWDINVSDVFVYERAAYPGGTITEDIKFPEAYDTSISPANKTANSGVTDGTGWTTSASSILNGLLEPFRAFDNSDTYQWEANGATGWIKIAKDSGTFNCTKVGIKAVGTHEAPKDFTIKDEADNALLTVTGEAWSAGETKYFTIATTGISAIKIDVTASTGGVELAIGEIKLYETISTAAGDLHLLINQSPLKPYLRQENEWVEKQFVKLGQAIKNTSILGDPVTYAFNGKTVLSQAVVSQQIYNLTHNIGSNIKPPAGKYNSIGGTILGSLVAGSGGYVIGAGGTASDYNEGSAFGTSDKLTAQLRTGDYIWYIRDSAERGFKAATAEVIIERSF